MTAPVAESQAAIAAGSQSFAAAAKLMPAGIREDTVMLYAWCRHADDVVDGQELGSTPQAGGDPAERLARLKADTMEALHGSGPVSAPFAALRAVARRHDFPDRWPLDLIDGFAMDVRGRDYRTLNDTLDYSYHVAGVVGVMMARVMGVRDQAVLDRACDLGLAFQLTNIARDVIGDARIGRLYLPGDWLEEAGASVEGDIPSPELYAVILRLLDAAEPYYASAAQAAGVEFVLMNTPPPNWAGGPRGFAAIPGGEERFRRDFDRALRFAQALRCRHIHVMAGRAEGEAARRTFVENLRWACARAPHASLLVEPINPGDMPGYFLAGFDQAAELIDEVAASNLGLQFDAYHAHQITGDVIACWDRHAARVRHIQIAGAPGRHEPKGGEINFAEFFRRVDASGYRGWVGAEYMPATTTEAGLRWLREGGA